MALRRREVRNTARLAAAAAPPTAAAACCSCLQQAAAAAGSCACAVAPPSHREDLGRAYAFITGGLQDLSRLPVIRPGALEAARGRGPETVATGERNDRLFRWCMAQARCCDDLEALADVAETWASAFPDPLTLAEVRRCAASAWSYETTGRNFLGLKRPQVTQGDRIMDELFDVPEALVLYQLFVRWHSGRTSFAIAPRAMAEAGNPPWPWKRIVSARDVLLERGFLEEVAAPRRGVRAGRYRLRREMSKSGQDHLTPAPPSEGWGWPTPGPRPA